MTDIPEPDAKRIPFSIRRGVGLEPADRIPGRGSVTGLANGKPVVWTPGGHTVDVLPGIRHTIPTLAPNLPSPRG